MQATSLCNITLLYVEDEAMIRNEFVEIIKDEVLELFIATNGKEGLKLYKEHQPDIIITDIQMPEMDGLTMSRAIFDINDKVPIIVSSALNETEHLIQCIQMGIQYYLLKPIDLNELFATLEKASTNVISQKRLKENMKLLTQYKDAVDRSEIVSKTDKNGIITYVNDAFCKISGYNEEELLGNPHNMVRHNETLSAIFYDMWKTVLSKKEWQGTLKNRAKNGTCYIVETTIIPVLNIRNEIEEFISIRKDVTQKELDKQRLEDNLKTSAQTLDEKVHFIYEYEEALKHNTLFCRMSQAGYITMASDAFIKLFSINESNVEGFPYLSLVSDNYLKKLDREVRNAIESHQTWEGVVKHKNLSDHELYLNTSFTPVMDVNENVQEVFCFLTDITKQVNLNREIISTQREVISTMGAIGETRSKETGDHVKRVAEYSKLLALKCGLPAKEAEEIKMASPMHDIGKVGIPDSILNKPGKLTEEEFEVIKTHSQLGYEMLKGSQQSLLKTAAIISLEHHEKWDGSGYPRGLKEKEIHLYGRITAIADVFDALGHDRIYKKAWPLEEILNLFNEDRGKHFDPELIDLFYENLDEFLTIKKKFDGNKGADFE